ncbi:MAG: NCS2 family permease [Desulfovibrionaceae bacterium]|nr:NCS2 family permease [Desulfovibrionaceae bacterium]
MFKLEQNGTTVRTELVAGVTTFMAMAYIIFVNPNMLAEAGMPRDAVFAATIWAAALATMLMGFWANMPIALAPGMGINAFFAYTVILGMGMPWQTALGCVFISGMVFFILTVTHLRELIIKSVPLNIKVSISVGIGMFIAFIGFKSSGIVVDNPATLVALGDMSNPQTLLAVFGLILIGTLMALNVRGAILFGILATTVLGMIVGEGPVPQGVSGIMSLDVPSFWPTFMELDVAAAVGYGLISVLFTMTMVDLFDSMGTIIGLSRKAGFMDESGRIDRLDKALVADSCGTTMSGIMGTPAVTCYVESAAGIATGGRTGLTAVTVAALFLVSLIFAPLVGVIQGYATAPALIVVGALMMQDVRSIDFSNMSDGLPAFLTIVTMPLTYSIATGFGMGFISYTLLKTLSGRAREVSPVMWVIAACFAVNFILR